MMPDILREINFEDLVTIHLQKKHEKFHCINDLTRLTMNDNVFFCCNFYFSYSSVMSIIGYLIIDALN